MTIPPTRQPGGTGFAARILRIILAGAVLAGCSGKGAPAAHPFPIEPSIKAGQPLVLEGVTVVDTRTGQLLEDRVVTIESGKIIRITDAGAMTEAVSANRVDARGKFLVHRVLGIDSHLDATVAEGKQLVQNQKASFNGFGSAIY